MIIILIYGLLLWRCIWPPNAFADCFRYNYELYRLSHRIAANDLIEHNYHKYTCTHRHIHAAM